jgi:hypothetical protein
MLCHGMTLLYHPDLKMVALLKIFSDRKVLKDKALKLS